MDPRAYRFGAIAGVATTMLVIVAFATSNAPPSVEAGGAPVAVYTAHSNCPTPSDMLWILGFGVFVFFAGWLRSLLREEPRTEWLATTALAGGAIAAAGASLYFGLDFTLASMPASIAPAAAQAVNLLALQPSSPWRSASPSSGSPRAQPSSGPECCRPGWAGPHFSSPSPDLPAPSPWSRLPSGLASWVSWPADVSGPACRSSSRRPHPRADRPADRDDRHALRGAYGSFREAGSLPAEQEW